MYPALTAAKAPASRAALPGAAPALYAIRDPGRVASGRSTPPVPYRLGCPLAAGPARNLAAGLLPAASLSGSQPGLPDSIWRQDPLPGLEQSPMASKTA